MADPAFRQDMKTEVINTISSIQNTALASTPQSGSLLWAVLWCTVRPSGGITPPSGWTLMAQQDDGNGNYQGAWRKVAGGSEPTQFTWTFASTFGVYELYVCEINGDIDGTTPIDVGGSAWQDYGFTAGPSVVTG